MGCSYGGGQGLSEVQRFPVDYDGVSSGSPLIIGAQHNIFYHPWESFINQRADGSRILVKSRIGILHDAVMSHCAAVSGVLDGLLLQPTACTFDPAWVQCKVGATDTSQCLTAEEVGVVDNLYKGPGDGKGHHFELAGFSMGSENMWGLSTADHIANPEAHAGAALKNVLLPPDGDKDMATLESEFRFNQEWYDKTLPRAPLSNSANTNIRPFLKRGGKLILWNGAADLTIQPEVAVAYYQGVQKELGTAATDTFMRLFMIPGFGHCEGGEMPFQFDVLSPLMAWTELHRAPTKIIAGKAVDESPRVTNYGLDHRPVTTPDQPKAFTRPVFRYPYYARYSGKGDAKDAVSYVAVKSGATIPRQFDTEAILLVAPDNQKFYHVENGQIVPDAK
jgi:feruloyl esterase